MGHSTLDTTMVCFHLTQKRTEHACQIFRMKKD